MKSTPCTFQHFVEIEAQEESRNLAHPEWLALLLDREAANRVAAASAAYWIASAASEIAIERTGMVGSIGVVAAIPVQVAPDAGGFEQHRAKHSK